MRMPYQIRLLIHYISIMHFILQNPQCLGEQYLVMEKCRDSKDVENGGGKWTQQELIILPKHSTCFEHPG